MSRGEKVLERVLSGESDANIRFDDMKNMLLRLGFRMRVRGSHHHFSKEGFELSNVSKKYRYMRCAQFGRWQGARTEHLPK